MDEYPAAVLAIILWMAGCQQQLWHNVSIFLCVIKERIFALSEPSQEDLWQSLEDLK